MGDCKSAATWILPIVHKGKSNAFTGVEEAHSREGGNWRRKVAGAAKTTPQTQLLTLAQTRGGQTRNSTEKMGANGFRLAPE
jgi:hypothetical protein